MHRAEQTLGLFEARSAEPQARRVPGSEFYVPLGGLGLGIGFEGFSVLFNPSKPELQAAPQSPQQTLSGLIGTSLLF